MNKYKTDVLKLNIQEQVQYLTDLHQAEKGLVSWGIRVIDRVDTVEELDNIDQSILEYGDAVAVGTESPFFFYIWTRASIGTDTAYWFPFGEITTPGPQGAPGESIVGPPGPRGTKWFTGSVQPGLDNEVEDGDIYLDPNGNVKQAVTYSNGTRAWVYASSIKGNTGIGNPGPAPIIQSNGMYITSTDPQTGITTNVVSLEEIKGDTGERGPAASIIYVRGILAQGPLPTPTELNDLSAAYLVGAASPYTLYIQVGSTPETAQWRDAGPLNAGTVVNVGGTYQTVWNADTKLDKRTGTSNYVVAYVKDKNGNQDGINIATTTLANSIVQRQSNAQIQIPSTPVASTDAASKNYVDTKANTKVDKVGGATDYAQVYGKTAAGTQLMLDISRSAIASALPQRQTNGNIRVPNTPSADNDAASKQYVDENDTVGIYKEYQGAATIRLEPDSYYMVFCNDPLLRILNKDFSEVVSGAKQLQFITGRIDGSTTKMKVCGQYWTGSALGGIEGFRRTVDIDGYLNCAADYAVCRLGKAPTI